MFAACVRVGCCDWAAGRKRAAALPLSFPPMQQVCAISHTITAFLHSGCYAASLNLGTARPGTGAILGFIYERAIWRGIFVLRDCLRVAHIGTMAAVAAAGVVLSAGGHSRRRGCAHSMVTSTLRGARASWYSAIASASAARKRTCTVFGALCGIKISTPAAAPSSMAKSSISITGRK